MREGRTHDKEVVIEECEERGGEEKGGGEGVVRGEEVLEEEGEGGVK